VKLVVELDGGQHNQCENKEYDSARSEYLKAQAIDVIRFWNHEVLLDIQSVLAELALKVTPPHLPFSKLIVSHIFLLDTGGAMIGFCIFI